MNDPPGGRPRPDEIATRAAYPWRREGAALEAAASCDVTACRTSLHAMAQELHWDATEGSGILAPLLVDLLARLDLLLGSGSAGAQERERQRERRVQRCRRLLGAGDAAALRRAFLQEAEEILRPLARGRRQSSGVQRARAYLDRHFTRRISLQELAQAVRLSPNYLSTVFRREVGKTVTEYLRERRTRMAQRLLLAGGQSISEVAYRVGYQNYRDFHRNFVRFSGTSPREFLRMARRDPAAAEGHAQGPAPTAP